MKKRSNLLVDMSKHPRGLLPDPRLPGYHAQAPESPCSSSRELGAGIRRYSQQRQQRTSQEGRKAAKHQLTKREENYQLKEEAR